MKQLRGFTLIEVSLTMVILGIIAALTLFKYQKTAAHTELEQAAHSLYSELRAARPLAFKWEAPVIVKFNSSGCTVCVDTNSNGTDANDICHTHTNPPRVVIRNPLSGTVPSLFGFTPQQGLADRWKDSLLVTPDSRGDYSHGTVYLTTERLPNIVYCIGIKTSMQSVILCKWGGTEWDTL